MPRTVITVPGAFVSYNTDNFGGALYSSPNVVIDDSPGGWNNWTLSDSAITTDMNDLYDLIIANINNLPDGMVVGGHSRGAQCIYKLFRQRLTDLVANVNPDKILFISSGNPERKWGGACVNNWDGKKPVYPGTQPYGNGYGLPLTNPTGPFKLLDIARQRDEWADYPNDFNNTAAMDAIGSSGVHSAYDGAPALGADGLPVNWDDWTSYVEGNITYLTAPAVASVTAPPKTFYATLHGGAFQQNRINDTRVSALVAQAPIENAYIRPVPVYPKVIAA